MFTVDVKTAIILVLLSVLFGVFATIKNYRVEAAHRIDNSNFSTILFFLIVGILLFLVFGFPKFKISPKNIDSYKPIKKEVYPNILKASLGAVELNNADYSSTYKVGNDDNFTANVNKSPINLSTHMIEFGIQLGAFNDLKRAKQYISTINIKDATIIFNNSDGLYKVIIREFRSRKLAKDYQKRNHTNGFIRQLDLENN